MSFQPLISIIVPVYNCEDYISSCIESIITQSMTQIELILVDDGSTDSSYSICERHKERYDTSDDTSDISIKLIHKANGGVSSARNTGIKAASGKYIMFVDSDDTLDKDCCRILYEAVERNHALLSLGGYNFITYKDEQIIKSTSIVPASADIFNLSDFKSSYSAMFNNRIYLSVWSKLFIRSLIIDQEIYFDEGLALGEDLLFTHSYIAAIFSFSVKASSDQALIAVCNKSLYNYNQYTTDSLSKHFGTDRIEKNALLFNKACRLVNSLNLGHTGLSTIAAYYMRSINIVFMHNSLSDPNTVNAFKHACSLPETKKALNYLNKKNPEQLLYILSFGRSSKLWLHILCTIRKIYLKFRD